MSHYLWIIDLPYNSRNHNGGLLRYFNLSRELVAQGHTVTFGVSFEDDRPAGLQWMKDLQESGTFSGFSEFDVAESHWNRLATLLSPFALDRIAIRAFREQTSKRIEDMTRQFKAEILIVSSRKFLYDANKFQGMPRIGDFSDSYTLFVWRELALLARCGKVRQALKRFPSLLTFFFRELHASRMYDANILVSPVDKKLFDRMCDRQKNRLLGNGVRTDVEIADVSKTPNQVVFSGAMDFSPNYEGAIWFIDHVLPIINQRMPDVVLVVAGAKPHSGLLARACKNVRILGFVEELNLTIAQSALYVAPLKSGSGFKNKVAEALVNGTWVIGTHLATEFLEPPVRDLIPVHDSPDSMANAICEFLSNPASKNAELQRLRTVVKESFSWSAKAEGLNSIAQSLLSRRRRD